MKCVQDLLQYTLDALEYVVPAEAGIQTSSSVRLMDLIGEKILKNFSKIY